MDICPFWQPATVLCVDCIVILWLNKILLLLQFHNMHNAVDGGVLQAMWEGLTGQVVHRDQLIIC